LNKLLSQYNDEKLVELYTQGNESALEELINRYQQKVFAYILMVVHDKDLAEDLFQDTFIKVINTLKLGLYREEGKFNQWLMRITRNLVIDHFRRCQKMSYVDNHETGDIFDSFSEPSMSIEQTMIMQQIYDSLHELISFLPEEQKEVLDLRIYKELSFKEIAEKTNVSINTALGRMRYAIINLRKMAKERNTILNY